jgi:hypothetical protein
MQIKPILFDIQYWVHFLSIAFGSRPLNPEDKVIGSGSCAVKQEYGTAG